MNRKTTVLATGADMKNRFLLAKGDEFSAGPDISDLGVAENYGLFRDEVLRAVKRSRPDTVVCDMHPGYFSTRLAGELSGSLVTVQHHHAHIASVMWENGLKGPVIGVSFDGTGYGTDGNIWGGEFLLVKKGKSRRLAHLKNLKMPGGDKVVSQPWRMVLSILGEKGRPLLDGVPDREKDLVLLMMEKDLNAPLTSSAGRLFDAAVALLGVCLNASFEAEGPVKLEKMCLPEESGSYPFKTLDAGGVKVIDAEGVFLGMVRDMKKHRDKGVIATRFHNSMSNIIADTVRELSGCLGIRSVALSGGVFQNAFLREKVMKKLAEEGLRVFVNRSLPASDLNIAWGQYYVSCGSR